MNDCLFCKMVKNEIPVDKVYEDEFVIIIKDIHPQAPVHLLAIPKAHYPGIHAVPDSESTLFAHLFKAIQQVLSTMHIADKGYRLTINSGASSGQSVHHIHVHVLSGRQLSASIG